MYITAKLPPSSPHFNHGTILRTGIYPALYFLFSILLLFLFKTLCYLQACKNTKYVRIVCTKSLLRVN